jgi:hypothetical protein
MQPAPTAAAAHASATAPAHHPREGAQHRTAGKLAEPTVAESA